MKSRNLFYESPDILPLTSILSPKRGEAEIRGTSLEKGASALRLLPPLPFKKGED
jgi:hypothetical protein